MNKIPSELLGKTIGIIGSPGSGKSFLASKFQMFENAHVVFENQQKFPKKIVENLKERRDLFETILWFRNKQIQDWDYAKSIVNKDNLVIIDSTFYQYQLYIHLYIQDKYYIKILQELAAIDNKHFAPPDIMIYISTTKKLVNSYLSIREAKWSLFTTGFINFLSSMAIHSQKFIESRQEVFGNLIEIKREDYDFDKQSDFNNLIYKIVQLTHNHD